MNNIKGWNILPSKKPLKTRDNETLVKDAWILITQEGLSYGTKWAALDDILWHWTERDGKFHRGPVTKKQGCSIWSEGALLALNCGNDVHPGNIQSKFRHEHVVPRAYLKHLILSQVWTANDLKQLLETCCIAVIVTKGEDKELLPKDSMPENWDWRDGNPWARYKINVYETQVKWDKKWNISANSKLVHSRE